MTRISFDPAHVLRPVERIRTVKVMSGSQVGKVYEVRLYMFCPCKSFRFRRMCRHLTDAIRTYRETENDPT